MDYSPCDWKESDTAERLTSDKSSLSILLLCGAREVEEPGEIILDNQSTDDAYQYNKTHPNTCNLRFYST